MRTVSLRMRRTAAPRPSQVSLLLRLFHWIFSGVVQRYLFLAHSLCLSFPPLPARGRDTRRAGSLVEHVVRARSDCVLRKRATHPLARDRPVGCTITNMHRSVKVCMQWYTNAWMICRPNLQSLFFCAGVFLPP
jgi:hypothetical protein